MPDFGIIVLTAFMAGAATFAVVLAYCSATDGVNKT